MIRNAYLSGNKQVIPCEPDGTVTLSLPKRVLKKNFEWLDLTVFGNASKQSRVRLLVVCVLMLFAVGATAQRKPMKSTFETFLDTQWWLGVRFGVNYTQPNVKRHYSAFSAINYEQSDLKKEYDSFQSIGAQAGMDISFYHKGFSVALQPTYKRMNYSYSNSLAWVGEAVADRFETLYEVDQFFNFFEVPLSLRYEILKKGKIRPFASAGVQYSMLISSGKDTGITHTDFTGGAVRSFSGGKVSLGSTNQFKGFFGAVGGVGAGFDYFNVRTVVAISYYYGLSEITDESKNFRDTELSSLGEANDKIKLNNLDISLSLVFPLRYIDKTFQPY
ncbi:MAG: hypothetical protein JXR03_04685 [Cyclobacteriaceae bacterium]